MNKNINITVVIISKNEEKNIIKCLDSIVRNIGEIEYEIIVVDSNSTDNTRECVQMFSKAKKLKMYNIESANQYSAALGRFIGTEKACGKYVLFLDSDMELQKDFINIGIQTIEKANKIMGVIGIRDDYKIHPNGNIDIDKNVYGIQSVKPCRHFGGAILFDKEFLKSVGGYNPKVLASEEPELYLRIKQKSKKEVYEIPHEMIKHNIHIPNKQSIVKKLINERSKGLGQTFRENLNRRGIVFLFKHKPLRVFFLPFVIGTISLLSIILVTFLNTNIILLILILNILYGITCFIKGSFKKNIYVMINYIYIWQGILDSRKISYNLKKCIEIIDYEEHSNA